jgi:hypothetical protein
LGVRTKPPGGGRYAYNAQEKPQFENYFEAADFCYIVMVDRYGAFLRRHHLMEQLMREDAQGLR